MTKVLIDDSLRTRLNGLNTHLEFCNESGRTVGHFLPDDVFREMLYAWLNKQVTDEELEEAAREPGGRTLAEIWKSLGCT